jgi:hypothetical protein
MLTERNQMMARPDRPWGDIERLQPLTVTGALRPGNSEKLVETFLVRLNAWAPQARARMNATA